MNEGTLRFLKIVTITMGVLIVLGVGVLIVTMARRGGSAPALPANLAIVLEEPAGTRIMGVTVAQDRLAVQVTGGGPDRVVLIDPRSGAVVGRISLAR